MAARRPSSSREKSCSRASFRPALSPSGSKLQHLPALPVVHALKVNARANGPVHGVGANAQLLLNLVQQVVGALGIPVHLVDKGEDGDIPHDADLKELAGLGFHALGWRR